MYGVCGTDLVASIALNAFRRIHIHFSLLLPGRQYGFLRQINAIHRADVPTGAIHNVDTRFSDDVGHDDFRIINRESFLLNFRHNLYAAQLKIQNYWRQNLDSSQELKTFFR
jgi:hypothetical protein